MSLTKEGHDLHQIDGGAVTVANSDDYGDDALYVATTSGMTAAYWQGAAGSSAIQFTGGETTTAGATLGYAGWSAPQLSCSFGLYLTALPTTANVQIAQFRTASGNVLGVTVTTSGKINVASTGALAGVFSWTSSAVLSVNTWYRIDLAAIISATAGQILAAVSLLTSATALSGGSVASASTLNMGTTPLAEFRFGKLSTGGALPNYFIRDRRATDTTTALLGPYTGAANQPPVVDAGNSQTVTIGATVHLTGTTTDADGSIASVAWSLTSSPGSTVTLTGGTTLSAAFDSTGKTAGDYRFTLTATDDDGATSTDTTVVTLAAAAPVVASGSVDSGYALIDASSSTGSGTVTTSISPTTNTTALGSGKYLVKQGTSAVTYTVTVTNGSASDTKTFSVSAQTAAGGTYTGTPVSIQLPVPLDPSTQDQWGDQLASQGFDPIVVGLNDVIRFLNGTANTPVTDNALLTESGTTITTA
jgi:hypothetical protein